MSDALNDYKYKYYQYGSENEEDSYNSPLCYLGTITIGSAGTAGTHTFTSGGWAKYITLGASEMADTGTATFEIRDVKGGTVFSQARVEKGTANYASAVPFGTAFSMVVTADAAQTATATAVFAIHYEK